MMSPLPQEVAHALDAIRAGATGDALESSTLDFKEDPARVPTRQRGSGNPDAKVVESVLDAAICFANGSAGEAHIVLGVADKRAGLEAFSGTDRDAQWVERKVFESTIPHLRVEARDLSYHEVRLLLIRVPEGLSVYTRTNGAARRRVGTQCVPMTENDRRALQYARANPDLTARPSSSTLDDLDYLALKRATELLSARRAATGDGTAAPAEPLALLRELGLLTDSGEITEAAVLLFGRSRPGAVVARHLLRQVPGGDPTVTEISGPVVLATEQLQTLIQRHSDAEIARVDLGTGQEVPVPAFPSTAVDEVVSNALVHRDWSMSSPVVVDQAPRLLKVWSPGALPFGVDIHRLLTVQSVPRNNKLMAGMRQLGLAEESSRGFDRMWRSMLATGREAPEVDADDFHVEVRLVASRPDTNFIAALNLFRRQFGDNIIDAVSTLIVLRHLSRAPLMTVRQVQRETQGGPAESLQVMIWLEDEGLVQPVTSRGDEWVLTSAALACLGSAVPAGLSTVSVQEWVEEHLRAGDSLTNRDIVEATGLDGREVTQLLRYLRQTGRAQIDPDGPSRGPTVRWRAAGTGPAG